MQADELFMMVFSMMQKALRSIDFLKQSKESHVVSTKQLTICESFDLACNPNPPINNSPFYLATD
jgi:hypothetical protein